MSDALEKLRAEKVDPKRKPCRDCGGPREVYFQVRIEEIIEGSRNRTMLKSKSFGLCAACALVAFEKATE